MTSAGLFDGKIAAAQVLTAEDVISIETTRECRISPNGKWIAYVVRSQRPPTDKAGSDYHELFVTSTASGATRPFITGEVDIRSTEWSPDGSMIAFLTTRGEGAKRQVWIIPSDGGEAFQATHSKTSVLAFHWHPDGRHIAYVATTPPSKREEQLKEKGYGFVFFEESLKNRNLYLVEVDPTGGDADPRQLTDDLSVWSFEFGPDGRTIALGATAQNLTDQRYVNQNIFFFDVDGGVSTPVPRDPSKLGNFAFSPDGSKLAFVAGRDRRDHRESHCYVVGVSGGPVRDLTPPGFRGHVEWVGWKDPKTLAYMASEGVSKTLNVARLDGGKRSVILDSRKSGFIPGRPSHTKDFKHFAMVGSSPDVPGGLFYWTPGKPLKRLTTLNPWLAERTLAKQEVIRYAARDGMEIEGILYYPVGYEEGKTYPLIVTVHGGPEAHYSLSWHGRYFHPAHMLAGKGYAVFLPNYRSSTGYGVDFTKDHLGDPAGKEFDDIADGIEHLIARGVADRERVGLGGGSYGGYAAAWFSSYYTRYVRAVCMFVGISNLISKRGTTDIPLEELMVHSGARLEDMWELSLERSPIYHAKNSRTAVLIFGGTDDPRVSPSQSIEYYRRLKMNNHPAVRLVRYPGERHGNSKQPGKIDVIHRTIQWYDWYVRDKKPIDGPMPPLDISDHYGLDLGDEQ
jgi:dipeptidyl aminopeptidase/acylaminoacyl peptidase